MRSAQRMILRSEEASIADFVASEERVAAYLAWRASPATALWYAAAHRLARPAPLRDGRASSKPFQVSTAFAQNPATQEVAALAERAAVLRMQADSRDSHFGWARSAGSFQLVGTLLGAPMEPPEDIENPAILMVFKAGWMSTLRFAYGLHHFAQEGGGSMAQPSFGAADILEKEYRIPRSAIEAALAAGTEPEHQEHLL